MDGFLEAIWGQDADYNDKVALLQEYMGLSLTNITRFQKMVWLIGAGSNGKSVILNVMRALVGDNNAASVALKDFSKTFSLVNMKDKLVNIDSEMAIDSVIADDRMKIVVGGDSIMVEQKMQAAFNCRLTAKQWAAANALPRTRDNSHGFFRRILILTFNRVFKDTEQDKQLEGKLMSELAGIFNWSLEGLQRLLENDQFTSVASSQAEIAEYKEASNPVEKFLKEHLQQTTVFGSPSTGTLAQDVYKEFKAFAQANGFSLLNSSNFGARLKALGVVNKRSNGKSYYPVRLRDTHLYNFSDMYPITEARVADINEAFA